MSVPGVGVGDGYRTAREEGGLVVAWRYDVCKRAGVGRCVLSLCMCVCVSVCVSMSECVVVGWVCL